MTVQAMVFGNADENSGSGVAFTRNPNDGTKALYGEYLIGRQGEDLVAGHAQSDRPLRSQRDGPGAAFGADRDRRQTRRRSIATRSISNSPSSPVDSTCCRFGPRSGPRPAAIRIAADLVAEG